ncbi:MAG TPA: carbohydrate-binding domain-containing protein [Clostridiales bacterium]|nr:carbohydrate-binding domain-containing protein [Clostridiales bacterium]
MKKKLLGILSALLITAMLLTGCTNAGTGSEATTEGTSASSSSDSTASKDGNSSSAVATTTSSEIVVDTEFSARDLEVGYNESTATTITLNGSSIEIAGNGATADGSILTISEEGTYVISGTLNDGQIIVDANADEAKVQLVLNGVTIQCSDNAPIYVKNADKVFITLAENSKNSLTDGTEYVQTDDNTVDGVIFSKADLTLNGNGSLDITGNYKHGIVSKDDLVITSGTYNITVAKDALNGKDCVKIKDGTLTLSATEGNGIQSKNGDDTTKGYVYIAGGTITVTNSQEGIEGTAIVIAGGTIDVTAQDDGLNAAAGSASTADTTTTQPDTTAPQPDAAAQDSAKTLSADSTEIPVTTLSTMTVTTSSDTSTDGASPATAQGETAMRRGPGRDGEMNGGMGGGEMANNPNCYISISGGTITINAEGDGIDSNGSIEISGGNVYVNGPTNSGNGAMDYNGTANITGGTVVIAGSVGMAQGFSGTSTQYSILYNFSASSAAGTEVTIKDADGNVVISYTPEKQYQSVVISSPDLQKDATYTITSGDQTADLTLSSVSTSGGEAGASFPGGMGGGRNGERNGGGTMPN